MRDAYLKRATSFSFSAAEIFQQILVGNERLLLGVGDRFRVGLRIVDGHFDVQVPEVPAPEAFDHAQRVAVRMAHPIEPAPVVEANGVDDQRVARPRADRIAHPSRLRIRRQLAAIQENLAEHRVLLVEDDNQPRRLDDFVRKRDRAESRHPGRLAVRDRVVFALVLRAAV